MQDAQRSADLCFEQWDKARADNTRPLWAQFNSYFTFALFFIIRTTAFSMKSFPQSVNSLSRLMSDGVS